MTKELIFKRPAGTKGPNDYTYVDVNVLTSEDLKAEMTKINEMLPCPADMSDGVSYFESVLKDSRNSRQVLTEVAYCLYKLCEKALPLTEIGKVQSTATTADATAPVTKDDLADFKQEMMSAFNKALQTRDLATVPPSETTHDAEEPKSPTAYKLEVELTCKESEDRVDVASSAEGEEVREAKEANNPWSLAARRGVAMKLGEIPAESFSVKKGGKTALVSFGTEEAKDKAKKTLGKDYKVTDGSKQLKKLLPRLRLDKVDPSLLDGDKDQVKVAIKESLLLKNQRVSKALQDDNLQTLEVIHFDKKREFAVLKVSPAIKALIKAGGNRLYLGCKVQEATDYVHLVQCYNCNAFGHKADACNRRGSVCLYCAGSHRSYTCTKKKQPKDYRCINCLNSNDKNLSSHADHAANDDLCPCVIGEHDYAISRLIDSAVSKNDYRRKIQSLREQERRH